MTLAKAQAEIERETGLTVSVGLAANKFLAKIASDLDKPRGFAVLGAEAKDFLSTKPVSILPGVGPAFVKSLGKSGAAHRGGYRPRRSEDAGQDLRRGRSSPHRTRPTGAIPARSIPTPSARASPPRPPSTTT